MKLENLKQGHCPICNVLIPHPAVVNISLSNNTVMPQPVCDNDFEKMLTKEAQEELLGLCKLIWIAEIQSGEQRTEQEKEEIIKQINEVEVVYA